MMRLTLVGALLLAALATSAPARGEETDAPYPPWQHGANNDARDRGLDFTVPEADDMADFHGDPGDPKLVLYVGGNYCFAMAPLVKAFEAEHPEFRGRLFWETIPPGLLVKQMDAGGRVTVGNMTFTAKPDVYLAGLKAVQGLVKAGKLEGPAVPYVTNTLTIMVAAGNPARVRGLADLARADLKLAMPNPAYEGIARQIRASLVKAGGEPLAKAVYDTKVSDGTAVLTHIHHRQTPLWMMQGKVQAGVTWQSEALFQEQVGHRIGHVDIPPEQNATAVYAGAIVQGCAHPEAAKAWLAFVTSPTAAKIFEGYGFKRYVAGAVPAGAD